MPDNILHDTALALKDDWGLQLPPTLTEEAILQLLADKIVAVIEKGPETFFQLMYRLDIPEHKLLAVLQDENAPYKIARLVYDRQLQKIKSRQENKMKNENDDPELEW